MGRVLQENFSDRMSYHSSRGRDLVYYIDGLNYLTCRALEQGGMMYYHTINRDNPINNQIRGISPRNPKRHIYFDSILALIDNGLYPENSILPLSYWENLTEEIFLNTYLGS